MIEKLTICTKRLCMRKGAVWGTVIIAPKERDRRSRIYIYISKIWIQKYWVSFKAKNATNSNYCFVEIYSLSIYLINSSTYYKFTLLEDFVNMYMYNYKSHALFNDKCMHVLFLFLLENRRLGNNRRASLVNFRLGNITLRVSTVSHIKPLKLSKWAHHCENNTALSKMIWLTYCAPIFILWIGTRK